MDRTEWSPPPAARPAPARTGASSETPARTAAHWFAKFIICMAFFGAIGALAGSLFPICLGLFLFFTDEDFVQWAFGALGIRLEPDTVGTEFVKSLVFLIGVAALISYWKDAAPAWLASQLPAGAPPWAVIAGIALLISLLSTASAWLMKSLLPEIARNSLSWTINAAGSRLACLACSRCSPTRSGRCDGASSQPLTKRIAFERILIGNTSRPFLPKTCA
jgi:hypothetical protein